MLQLHQYLSGEPLCVVESFWVFSWGLRITQSHVRQAVWRRATASSPPRRGAGGHENYAVKPKDLERFVDLLTIAVSNLKDAGRGAELQPDNVLLGC